MLQAGKERVWKAERLSERQTVPATVSKHAHVRVKPRRHRQHHFIRSMFIYAAVKVGALLELD